MAMEQTRSKDGTVIAFERAGSGPPLVLVDGALCYRASGPAGPLAKLLVEHFTVLHYDRRGRGDSTNTLPYAPARELEDLEAVIDAAGGTAFVYGSSSGAVLALDAAAALGAKVKKVVAFEAPCFVDDTRPPLASDYVDRMNALIAADDRGAAVKHFLTKGVGLSPLLAFFISLTPGWKKLKAVAPTLAYDVALTEPLQRGRPLPTERWKGVTAPALVVDGSKSPTWMRNATKAVASIVPGAAYRTLPGQTHMLEPRAIAPVLIEWLLGAPTKSSTADAPVGTLAR
jgi:pimeloyl-ACP methyl ester carboxylesterase